MDYATRITRPRLTDDKGEDLERESPSSRATVFNAEQCHGLPASFNAPAEPPALSPLQRLAATERFFANINADIRSGGTRTYLPRAVITSDAAFETFRTPRVMP